MNPSPYHNPWIPKKALDLLATERGTILDVGGGAAPYYRATHIIDIQPYDEERLRKNAWGGTGRLVLSPKSLVENKRKDTCPKANEEQSEKDYTQRDICNGERWPFEDKQFDLGLSSHCLEDLRDPVQVVKEMGRCCKTTLIICPSRLFEQMRGVDHPRYCGMDHHLWLVSEKDGELLFRRKTQLMEFPRAHLKLPPGKQLKVESGSMVYYSEQPRSREIMCFNLEDDLREYRAFVERHCDLTSHLEQDPRWRNWRRWWWHARQWWHWEI